ncbi:MAG: beta-ketoacyl-ACP synthase II [Chloroflexi bacterium]|nr:beta-ketoacyl-ACP synthase II [Chloroflexota bacterium]MYB16404.1 beta-ketoacyl-ACP synthase II [Chloroflexota bacterium]MYC48626.1 beta-ketoacyl-ACP synthase II [Chloroflexota bacterium]
MGQPIAITGIGLVTPLGNDPDTLMGNLMSGKCAIGRIDYFDPSPYSCQLAAQVRDFDAREVMGRDYRRTDQFVHFAVGAARSAIADSGLELDGNDELRESTGVFVGSGIGGIATLFAQTKVHEDRGTRRVTPFLVPMMIANMAAGQIAIDLGLKGPNMAHVTACATSANSIGEAVRALAAGSCDVILAGGSEAAITPIGLSGFTQGRAMSTHFNDCPHRSSRPFDGLRDGFVAAEGAGVLVLETMEHAQGRGARIYATVDGYGASADAFHITAPPEDGEGAALSMKRALKDAKLNPEDIGYINAHGTSTPIGDLAETRAIHQVFGKHARSLVVNSTKSMIGHMIGAAGVVEAAVGVLSMRAGAVHATINQEEPDPECDLDYVPNEPRDLEFSHFISNSFGFGGHNVSLVISRA